MFIIVLCLLLSLDLICQDIEPSKIKISYNGTDESLDNILINQNKIIHGFQWNSNLKIGSKEALNSNAGIVWREQFKENYEWYINKKDKNGNSIVENYSYKDEDLIYAIAPISNLINNKYFFFFEPQGIHIDPSIEYSFDCNKGDYFSNYQNIDDRFNPVFGFSTSLNDGIVVDNNTQTGITSTRVKLVDDPLVNEDIVILDKPYGTKYLYRNDDLNSKLYNQDDANGKVWYLSICLRRSESDNGDKNNLPVLEIEMPSYYLSIEDQTTIQDEQIWPDEYNINDEISISNPTIYNLKFINKPAKFTVVNKTTLCDGNYMYNFNILTNNVPRLKNLNFASEPDITKPEEINYSEFRGITYKQKDILNYNTDLVVITNNHLPIKDETVNGVQLRENITLTYKIVLDNDPDRYNNPKLKNKQHTNSAQPNELINFGIKIKYKGNADIEIDWIRIENPFNYRLMSGVFDEHESPLVLEEEVKDASTPIQYDQNGVVQLLSGSHDLTLKKMLESVVQQFDSYPCYELIGLLSMNGHDGSRVPNWLAIQYFNKLVSNKVVLSQSWPDTSPEMASLGPHHMGMNNNLINGPWHSRYSIPPYLAPSNSILFNSNSVLLHEDGDNQTNYPTFYECLGIKMGYRGWNEYWKSEVNTNSPLHAYLINNPGSNKYQDEITNSFYETSVLKGVEGLGLDYFPYNCVWFDTGVPNYTDSYHSSFLREMWTQNYTNHGKKADFNVVYNNRFLHIIPKQFINEKIASFYKENESYFFNDPGNWWAQTYDHLTIKMKRDDLNSNFNQFGYFDRRPKTAEEIRYNYLNPIIFGAKGLVPDISSGRFHFNSPGNNLGLDYNNDGNDPFIGITEIVVFTGHFVGKSNYNHNLNTNWSDLDDLSNDNGINVNNIMQNIIIGKDYFDTGLNKDIIGLTDYFNPSTLKEYWDVDENKIYYGYKSVKFEIKKIFDFLDANSDELMNLKLKAWWGKGYQENQAWSNNFNENPLLYYVDTPPSKSNPDEISNWKLRPIDRKDNLGQAFYEPWDSAFIDITLLESTETIEDPIKEVFYLGIQNRRTDPLIFEDGNDKPTFVSGADFDDFIENGDGVLTPSEWQDLWWKRLGAREITIPFKLDKQALGLDDDKYYLIRIEEIGRDHYFNLSHDFDPLLGVWNDKPGFLWASEDYMDCPLETIGEDKSITVKFLPGEAKIFKCEILESGDFKGILDHDNQANIVMAEFNNGFGGELNEDYIQYYTAYYKEIPNQDDRDVFFRSSKPISTTSGYENVEWNSEIKIDDAITQYPYQLNDLENCDCAYPSIFVEDIEGHPYLKEKVRIVYACDSPDDIFDLIAETIVNIDNLGGVDGIHYSYYLADTKLDYSKTDPLRYWGTPVIGDLGDNIAYAWSSKDEGINVGYQGKSTASPLAPTQQIKIRGYIDHQNSNTFNNYQASLSTFNEGSNLASLVWINNKDDYPNTGESGSVLNYTLLKVENNSLVYDLPNNSVGGNNYKFFDNNNILNLNTFIDVEFCNPLIYTALDNIFLQSDYWYDIIVCNFNNGYSFNTILNFPINEEIRFPSYGNFYHVGQLNISQPNSTLISSTYLNFNLDFTFNSLILHKTMKSQTLIGNDPISLFSSNPSQPLIIGNGDSPTLVRSNSTNYYDNIWKNRRIYHHSPASPNFKIYTNAEGFYKQNVQPEQFEAYVGFSSTISNFEVDLLEIDGSYGSWNLPLVEIYDTLGQKLYISENDTIYSNWFEVDNLSNLELKSIGDPFNKEIRITHQNSGSFTVIPLAPSSDLSILYDIDLINGQNQNYRLEFFSIDTNDVYSERLDLGGSNNLDTINLKQSDRTNRLVINLGDILPEEYQSDKILINVSPNPTNDYAYISIGVSENHYDKNDTVKMIISDTKGNKIFDQEVRPFEVIRIDLSEYAQGIYFINCYQNKDIIYQSIEPSSEILIIER